MRAAPDREAQVARRTRNYAILVRAVDLELATLLTAPSRPRAASWSRTTTPSATSPPATASTWSGRSSRRAPRSRSRPPGNLPGLADTIEREDVRAVFPESSVSADVARTIARQTGADASHVLYADTLGPAGSRGATYIGMMDRQRRLDRARPDR